MVWMRYKDPNDGLFKLMPSGGTAEVTIASLQPAAGTETLLWVDQDDGSLLWWNGTIYQAVKSGVSAHSALTGLLNDDHTQYLNNARGDARYVPLTRSIIAGAGLTGGGALSSDPTINVVGDANLSVAADQISVLSAPKWTTARSFTFTGDATGSAASVDGSAAVSIALTGVQAAKWTTGRTISLTGDVTGTSAAFDGSAALSFATTIGAGVIVDADVNATAAIAQSKISGLSTSLSGKVDTTRSVIAGMGLMGGGALSADVTLNVVGDATLNIAADQVSVVSAPKWTTARSFTFTGDATGSAASVDGSANVSIAMTGVQAAKWTTGRTISLTGDVTGTSAAFDGSAALSFATAIGAGVIVDADVSSSAAIAQSKVASLTTDLAARVLKAGDTMSGFLTLSADPTSAMHAATKQYTDNKIAIQTTQPAGADWEIWVDTDEVAQAPMTQAQADARYVEQTGDTMTGTLTMSNASISMTGSESGADRSIVYMKGSGTDVALFSYANELHLADNTWSTYRKLSIGAPTGAIHATTKNYVDTADATKLTKSGDSMTGQLGLVAPTSVTNAARWADGVPRFTNSSARDSAYASIGGPIEGYTCWLLDIHQQQTYYNSEWCPSGGVMPGVWTTKSAGTATTSGVKQFYFTPDTTWWYPVGGNALVAGTNAGTFRSTVNGRYQINVQGNFGGNTIGVVGWGKDQASGVAFWGGSVNTTPTSGQNARSIASGILSMAPGIDHCIWISSTVASYSLSEVYISISYVGMFV